MILSFHLIISPFLRSYPLLLNASLRVLVYNGDWDACVPYTDGEAWTSSMGFPVKRQWQVRLRGSVCAFLIRRLQRWTFTSEAFNTTEVWGCACAAGIVAYDALGAGGRLQHGVRCFKRRARQF